MAAHHRAGPLGQHEQQPGEGGPAADDQVGRDHVAGPVPARRQRGHPDHGRVGSADHAGHAAGGRRQHEHQPHRERGGGGGVPAGQAVAGPGPLGIHAELGPGSRRSLSSIVVAVEPTTSTTAMIASEYRCRASAITPTMTRTSTSETTEIAFSAVLSGPVDLVAAEAVAGERHGVEHLAPDRPQRARARPAETARCWRATTLPARPPSSLSASASPHSMTPVRFARPTGVTCSDIVAIRVTAAVERRAGARARARRRLAEGGPVASPRRAPGPSADRPRTRPACGGCAGAAARSRTRPAST